MPEYLTLDWNPDQWRAIAVALSGMVLSLSALAAVSPDSPTTAFEAALSVLRYDSLRDDLERAAQAALESFQR